MRGQVVALVDWLTSPGVSFHADAQQQRRVRLTNGISVLLIAMVAPYIPIDMVLGQLPMVVISGTLLLLYAGVLLLNARGRFVAARSLMLLSGSAAIFLSGSMLGPESGIDLFCFSAAALPFLVTRPQERGLLAVGVLAPILASVGLHLTGFSLLGTPMMPAEFVPFFYTANVATCFLVQTIEVGFFAMSTDRALESVAHANREMRRVLDSVEQGLVTVSRDGRVGEQRSAAFEQWLGTPEPGQTLPEWLRQRTPEAAEWMELGWEALQDGFLPPILYLDQLPSRIVLEGTTLELRYQLIGGNEHGEGWEEMLVVCTDITARLEAEEAEAAQRELLGILNRVFADRSGALAFFSETSALVLRVVAGGLDVVTAMRDIHTIKGNTALFGLTSISRFCHTLETALAESGGLPTETHRAELLARWRSLEERLRFLLDTDAQDHIEIDRDELERLATALDAHGEHTLAIQLRSWALQPVRAQLQRLGEQARALAERLGKGTIRIQIEDSGIRLPERGWGPLWSTLVHAVRNAVDHGLESAGERGAAGRPPAQLRLLAQPAAVGKIQIHIIDNGRGVDWEKIRTLAGARGLPAETHADLVDALFSDGLSTRTQVTEVSGRGVGLAALRAAVADLGGQIDVESRIGQGTTMCFTLPAGDAYLPALLPGLAATG